MARDIVSFQPFGNALRGAEKKGQEQKNQAGSFKHATDFLVARVKTARRKEKNQLPRSKLTRYVRR